MCDIPLASKGTLVLAVPTKDGFVVAADSRSTVNGQFSDGNIKLHGSRMHPPVLIAITGTANFLDPNYLGRITSRPLPRAAYQYCGVEVVQAHLGSSGASILSGQVVAEAASVLANSLAGIRAALAGSLRPLFPKGTLLALPTGLCRLVLFQVLADGSMTVGTSELLGDPSGNVMCGYASVTTYRHGSDKDLLTYGEDQYALQHVWGPGGTLPLHKHPVWIAKTLVSDFSQGEAVELCRDILRATEAATLANPARSGIGGPVMACLVTHGSIASI